MCQTTWTRSLYLGSNREGESPLTLSDELCVHNFETPFQTLDWIVTHGRPPLVGHKSGVSQIGDRVGDEPVVEFLFVVDFQTAGHTSDVDVADVVNVVAKPYALRPHPRSERGKCQTKSSRVVN